MCLERHIRGVKNREFGAKPWLFQLGVLEWLRFFVLKYIEGGFRRTSKFDSAEGHWKYCKI